MYNNNINERNDTILFFSKLLQVFESNGDYLDDALFTTYSFKYLKQISERVRKQLKEANIPEVPMVFIIIIIK